MVVSGNPLGPVRVAIFGKVLWDGLVTPAMVTSDSLLHNFVMGSSSHWSILGSAVVSPLHLPGLTLLAGSVALPWALWRQARDRAALLAVTGLCVACLYLYVSSPWSGRFPGEPGLSSFMGQAVRYGLPFLGLLAVLTGASCRWARSWALTALVLVGYASGMVASVDPWGRVPPAFIWPAMIVTIGIVLGLTGRWLRDGGLARRSTCRRPRSVGRVCVFIVAGMALLALGLATTSAAGRFRHRIQDRLFGGIVRFVDDELPRTARLGFWGHYPAYVLYGKHFRRQLKFVELQNARTEEELVRIFKETGIDAVAVGPRGPAWTSVSAPAWSLLAERGGHFERIHGRDVTTDVMVYRLKRR
jgi:hypothetical protein